MMKKVSHKNRIFAEIPQRFSSEIFLGADKRANDDGIKNEYRDSRWTNNVTYRKTQNKTHVMRIGI